MKQEKNLPNTQSSDLTREQELLLKISELEEKVGGFQDLIKESSDIRQHLQESEARLQMAVEATKLGTWDYKPITNELFWSAECKKVFGASPDREITFSEFTEHIHPEDRQHVEEAVAWAIDSASDGSYDITFRILQFDTHLIRTVRSQGKVYFNSQKEASRFFGTVMDVTDQQVAEAQSAILAAIIASSDDAIISKTLEGVITSWNDSAKRLFGYKPEEIIGKSVLTLIPEDRLEEEPEILSRLKQGLRVDHFETQRLRKDKSLIDISLSISPVRDNSGKIIGVSKIARDITERKIAEKLLKEREEYFRLALDAGNLGTFDMDFQKRHIEWDERAREFLGIHKAETLNEESYVGAIHEADRSRVLKMMDSVFRARQDSFDVEFRTMGLEDHRMRWLRAMGKVFYNDYDKPVRTIGTILDITNQKQIEIKKNDFIAIVSHELKTPLTSVKSYIQVLLAKAIKEDNVFSINALSRAELQTNKMAAMINDFLSLARLEEGKIRLSKEKFELLPLLRELVEETQFLEAGHTISLEACEGVFLNADKDKLGQIILNLLSNAIKYSSKGSTVRIGCELRGEKVKIFVKDEGIGINQSDQRRLFERFYRVENEKLKTISGFGIGLYLVSELLKYHDSKIEITSEEGQGSEFYFYLPVQTN